MFIYSGLLYNSFNIVCGKISLWRYFVKVFEHPNLSGDWKCPLCGKKEDKPVVLIPAHGTQEGNNIQARQYHLDCIDLTEVDISCGAVIIAQRYIKEE